METKFVLQSVVRHKENKKCYVIIGSAKTIADGTEIAILSQINEEVEKGKLYSNYLEGYDVLERDYEILFNTDDLIGMVGFLAEPMHCDGLPDIPESIGGLTDPNWDGK